MSINTEDLKMLISKAEELALAGNWGDDAIQLNTRILELDIKIAGSYTRLACCFRRKGDLSRTKDMYLQVLAFEPENTIAQNGLLRAEEELSKEKIQEKYEEERRNGEIEEESRRGDEEINDIANKEQEAVVNCKSKYSLVIAAAGSGKTTVLTERIAHLIKQGVPKERILALAFNKDVAEEIKEKLSKKITETKTVGIMTFHKLGRTILGTHPKLFDITVKKDFAIIWDTLKTEHNEKFLSLLLNYDDLQYSNKEKHETFPDEDFSGEVSYAPEFAEKKYKSPGECLIARLLTFYDIPFQYKPPDWMVNDSQHGTPQPDFYLSDHDCYIEFWALDENSEPPKQGSENYLENMVWKLEQFDDNKKKLINLFYYEYLQNILEERLRNQLKSKGIEIKPMSVKEFINKVKLSEQKQEIFDKIAEFVTRARKLRLDREELRNRVKNPLSLSHPQTPKIKKLSTFFGFLSKILKYLGPTKEDLNQNIVQKYYFQTLATAIYCKYCEHLETHKDEVDFTGMIYDAIDFIKNYPEKVINKYSHILVDEFQDISAERLKLIQELIKVNRDATLFCVGDDWQSIYGFTGSDVNLFINFKEYFPIEKYFLEVCHRCPPAVVNLGSEIIKKNINKIPKTVLASKERGNMPILYVTSPSPYKHIEECSNLIVKLIKGDIEPDKILVLARYNDLLKNLERSLKKRGIPFLNKRFGNALKSEEMSQQALSEKKVSLSTIHRSKGLEREIVILLNISSGRHGFPSGNFEDEWFDILEERRDPIKEEERRLFYVAVTRAKERLFILTKDGQFSEFLNELPFGKFMEVANPKCPTHNVPMLLRNGRNGDFWGCPLYKQEGGCMETRSVDAEKYPN